MARPRSDIQSRIVHAARRRFLAEGVDGASLRTIASDAKTNVGMISYYFTSKDDLFLAVVEEIYARLLDDIGRGLAGAAPLQRRLARVFERIGRASDDELAVIRLVAREALLSSRRFDRLFARAQRGHFRMFVEEIRRGMQSGAIDDRLPVALLLVTTLAMGVIPQVVRRAAGDRPPFAALPAPDALARMSANLLFKAVGRKRRRKGTSRSDPLRTP